MFRPLLAIFRRNMQLIAGSYCTYNGSVVPCDLVLLGSICNILGSWRCPLTLSMTGLTTSFYISTQTFSYFCDYIQPHVSSCAMSLRHTTRRACLSIVSGALTCMMLIRKGRHVVAQLPLLVLLPGTAPHKYFIVLWTLGTMAQSLSLSLSLSLAKQSLSSWRYATSSFCFCI
jgi:hypothetical protein